MDSIIKSLGFDVHVFVYQVVLFVALVLIMNQVFWKPMLSHLAKRDEDIADAYRTVEKTRTEMEQLRADYQARITQMDAEARARINAAIKEAQTERERIIAEARVRSDKSIKDGAAGMQRETEQTLANLADEISGLAVSAAGKALGPTADMESLRQSVNRHFAAGSADASRN